MPDLRPATNADADGVRALVFRVLAEYGLTPDPAATDADLDDIEASYFARGGWFEVWLDKRGAVIGSYGLHPRRAGVCELRKMYLARAWRGRGLGRMMLERALARARALGFGRVELETASVLREATALYRSCGFEPFEPEHMAPRADLALGLDL
jgi:putative acetyltransferase